MCPTDHLAMLATISLGLAMFPEAPIESEVGVGRELARKTLRQGVTKHIASLSGQAQLERPDVLFARSRVPIGSWSDGFRKVDVEWVVPIDAELCSRWMGYLDVRDGWTGDEMSVKWSAIRSELAGKRAFVVILSAFPTKPTLGLGETKRTTEDETEDVRFVFETPVGKREAGSVHLASVRTKGKGELDLVPWWQATPIGLELQPAFEPVYERPLVSRGDYRRSFWWVWTEDDFGDGALTLSVLSRRKIRSATFAGAKSGT